MRTWKRNDPDLTRPIAAPSTGARSCSASTWAATREAAAKVKPHIRADGTRVWSLMQLERQLRPGAGATPAVPRPPEGR